MTNSVPDRILFEITALPMAWTIVRQYRSGFQGDPAKWLKATHLPKDTQALVDSVEYYLSRDDTLVDLGSWVLEDLPAGVAHMIDTSSDLLWTLVILLTAGAITSGEHPLAFRFGSALHSSRDQLRKVIGEIEARSSDIERDFELRNFSEGLPGVRQAVDRAIVEYDKRVDQETIARPLSKAKIEAMRESLRGGWAAGFPRILFHEIGAEAEIRRPAKLKETLRIGSWMPREILQDDTSFVDDSPRRVGQDLARALTAGESQHVGKALGAITPSVRGSTLERRIANAIKAMGGATHLLLPYSWRVLRELALEEVPGPRLWTYEGLEAREWRDTPPHTVVLLRLPEAILIETPVDFQVPKVEVAEVDTQRATELAEQRTDTPDGADPISYWMTRVLVDARVPWIIRIRRKGIRVVSIPEALREVSPP